MAFKRWLFLSKGKRQSGFGFILAHLLIDRLWRFVAVHNILLRKSLLCISGCILNHVFVMRGYLVPSISLDRACPCRRVRSLLARDLRGTPISVGSHPNLVIASSWALSIFLYSIHKEHGMNLQVSSITSSSSTPAGVRPSLISFSSLVISARLLAFLISASNLAFSFSFSLTFGCLEAPFASGAM